MGLISEEVEVRLSSNNIKWYEDKGYEIPKRKDKWGKITTPKGTYIKIRVEDLPNGSSIKIDVQCDNCNKIFKRKWLNYKRCVHEDNKYYCNSCIVSLIAAPKIKNTKLKNSISFQQWCLNNNYQNVLNRWDYDLNKCSPDEINYKSEGLNRKGYWFKCPNNKHESELKRINDFIRRQKNNLDCNQCNSISETHYI